MTVGWTFTKNTAKKVLS